MARRLLPILLLVLTASLANAQSIFNDNKKWNYTGCYTETTTLNATNNLRALSGATETSENMTVPICLDFCDSKGSSWAGVEYTKECYCGASVNSLSTKEPDVKCNLPCVGNSTQICGGSLLLSVYQKNGGAKGGAGEVRVGSVLALGVAVVGALVLA